MRGLAHSSCTASAGTLTFCKCITTIDVSIRKAHSDTQKLEGAVQKLQHHVAAVVQYTLPTGCVLRLTLGLCGAWLQMRRTSPQGDSRARTGAGGGAGSSATASSPRARPGGRGKQRAVSEDAAAAHRIRLAAATERDERMRRAYQDRLRQQQEQALRNDGVTDSEVAIALDIAREREAAALEVGSTGL